MKTRGMAVVSLLIWIALILVIGGALLSLCTTQTRQSRADETHAVTAELAEAGAQQLTLLLWNDANGSHDFTTFDADTLVRGTTSLTGTIAGGSNEASDIATRDSDYRVKRYTASVTSVTIIDSFTREVVVRATGWIDLSSGSHTTVPAGSDPTTTIERRFRYIFQPAHVFDYAYFVNNYGWMTGFNSSSLVVNGDMRANGDFNIDGGTVNGKIVAEANPNVWNTRTNRWGADGYANVTGDVQAMSNSTYNSTMLSQTGGRARQAYDPTRMGNKQSASFQSWKDVVYDQTPDPSVILSAGTDVLYGAVIEDSRGTRAVTNPSGPNIASNTTDYLPMPDLSDITQYQSQSSAYRDSKQTFLDGTANPDYNQPAYLEVWDSTSNAYKRITGQSGDPAGTINGSALLVGTSQHPIRIHGPVTVLGDVGIKGYVSGQGTLYTGRNVHVLGDVKYSNPPSFDGSGAHGNSPSGIDQDTDQKTLLGLCARGSVIMGNPKNFSTNPLQYMEPPFTKSRRSDDGTSTLAAYDATQTDSAYRTLDGTTPKKYQSLLKQSDIDANASAITQIDAVMYTNNCAGGLCGDGTSKGFTINGSVISKDEAMVINLGGGGRMTMNYDERIKERALNSQPLINLNLPRTLSIGNIAWREVKP